MGRIVPATSPYGETWYEIWDADKRGIISTMYRNLAADLQCGYNPMGATIEREKQEIRDYESAYKSALDSFKTMTDDEVNRWCFFELKKSGAIS